MEELKLLQRVCQARQGPLRRMLAGNSQILSKCCSAQRTQTVHMVNSKWRIFPDGHAHYVG